MVEHWGGKPKKFAEMENLFRYPKRISKFEEL